MWLINLLPDWVFGFVTVVIVAAFIAATVIRRLPAFAAHKVLAFAIQIASALAFLAIVFVHGMRYNDHVWQDRVKEAEERARIAEALASEINSEVIIQYKDRVKVIKDTQIVVEQEIIEKATVIDAKCEFPAEAIDIHNKSAVYPGDLK